MYGGTGSESSSASYFGVIDAEYADFAATVSYLSSAKVKLSLRLTN
jgi:hypothetical protein